MEALVKARLPLSKFPAWEEQIEELEAREARNKEILAALTQLKNLAKTYKEELARNKEQLEDDLVEIRGRVRSMAKKVEACEEKIGGEPN